jgi:uracil phosphoribosyltransferase
MNRLAEVLFLEASEDLGTEIVSVESPLAKVEGVRLEKPLVLCPILRAGLGLAEGISPLVPEARVAHIGLARDEETAKATCYYAKFPPNLGDAEVFLLDPMLATGGSAVAAADQLKAAGARNLRFICVVGCQQGVEAFHDAHPEVPITTAAIDPGLNLQSYIVPGLGDAGDRYFGT